MEQTENKMGVMPVNKLILTISLPMMLSMLVQALYNIVDSIFVARVCEEALTAVSLAFPYQNLMIAVASGTGVGMNALLSRGLGERNFAVSNRAAGCGILLAGASALVFTIAGCLLHNAFFSAQLSPDVKNREQIITYGSQYLLVVSGLSFGLFGQIVFERLLQSTGKTLYTMFSQGLGAVVNIILDPILIFGMFGFPRMEVAGAALATVIGQFAALGLGVFFHLRLNHEIRTKRHDFIPDLHIIKRIYAVGLPSILMASLGSVMTYCMNYILSAITITATTVFGVYFKLQSFVLMPVFGLNNGMIPVLAYNYGARKRQRIIQSIKYSMLYAVVIMTVGFAVFQLLPGRLLLFFDATAEMLEIGIPALRIISFGFLFAGFGIVMVSVFQALGNGIYSFFASFLRQLVCLLPLAYLFSLTGRLGLIWLSFPLAELIAAAICALLLRHTLRTLEI